MKTRTILTGPVLLLLLFVLIIPAPAQTTKPAGPSRQQAADVAARKQLAAYMADFRAHPEDAALRDKIIELAKTLKLAPAVPLAVKSDFTKAAAQLKSASTADDFKAAAKLFEEVAVKAPWYADAYYNAAAAYAKAADYDSAKRNLALYLAAVRPGVDTQKAEGLGSDIEQQQAIQRQQQEMQRFQQALQEFRTNPNDAARERIIKLAQTMKPAPEIPEEAREHYVMAAALVEKAKSGSGFESAIEQYKAALLVAPWWADAYKKLAIAQKAADHYDDAIASLNLYLLTQPADARDAQDEIYKLKAAKQAVAQAAAEEQQRRVREEQQRQARQDQFVQEANQGIVDLNRGPAGYSEALRHLKAALELSPDHPEVDMVYCRLGEVYMNLGNLDEAYKFYQKTFELKPMPRADHAFCATNFGVVLERRGDRAGSCRIWRVGCNAGSQVSCGNLNGC